MRKLLLAAIAASLSTPSPAQEGGAAILYSKGHFSGTSKTVAGPATNMPPFPAKSLRIPSGTRWELCSGNSFTGCETFSESKAAMARTVRSMRPVSPPIPENMLLPNGPLGRTGGSLRGFVSEFFVVPAAGGSRIEVTDSSAESASRAATEFCRAHGWRMSAYQRVQTVSGRTFLGDVLCVNEDR